jgi:hypothetical protein
MDRIPYPKDLSDIVQARVMRGQNKHDIFDEISRDVELKKTLAIDNEQIISAIYDAMLIFGRRGAMK